MSKYAYDQKNDVYYRVYSIDDCNFPMVEISDREDGMGLADTFFLQYESYETAVKMFRKELLMYHHYAAK